MTTLNKSDLQKFSEQYGLQVDGRSEFAYTDRLEHFSRLVRLDLELEIDDLKDQLVKANQLWQIAQGRCDGLEEKLATAQAEIKRMEERRCEICGYAEHRREHHGFSLFTFPPTAEQIANETAEAIAEYCSNLGHYCLSAEIESGAWKDFKK